MSDNGDFFRNAKFGEIAHLSRLDAATSSTLSKFEKASAHPEDGYSSYASTDPLASTMSYAYSTLGYAPSNTELLIEEIHQAVCRTLPNSDAVEALKKILEDIPCPVDDCKKCRFYNPGSVDVCNTAAKTAEFLIYNDYVRVSHKAIDKVKDS